MCYLHVLIFLHVELFSSRETLPLQKRSLFVDLKMIVYCRVLTWLLKFTFDKSQQLNRSNAFKEVLYVLGFWLKILQPFSTSLLFCLFLRTIFCEAEHATLVSDQAEFLPFLLHLPSSLTYVVPWCNPDWFPSLRIQNWQETTYHLNEAIHKMLTYHCCSTNYSQYSTVRYECLSP